MPDTANYERHKKMMEERLRSDGLVPDEWREGEDGLEAVFRGEWEALTELDGGIVSEGESGNLSVVVVGSPEFGNERVQYNFTPEGSDVGVDCQPFENVESVA